MGIEDFLNIKFSKSLQTAKNSILDLGNIVQACLTGLGDVWDHFWRNYDISSWYHTTLASKNMSKTEISPRRALSVGHPTMWAAFWKAYLLFAKFSDLWEKNWNSLQLFWWAMKYFETTRADATIRNYSGFVLDFAPRNIKIDAVVADLGQFLCSGAPAPMNVEW